MHQGSAERVAASSSCNEQLHHCICQVALCLHQLIEVKLSQPALPLGANAARAGGILPTGVMAVRMISMAA